MRRRQPFYCCEACGVVPSSEPSVCPVSQGAHDFSGNSSMGWRSAYCGQCGVVASRVPTVCPAPPKLGKPQGHHDMQFR